MAKKEFFRLVDYTGGINTDQHINLIQDSEAVEIVNFRLDKQGSLITREGLTPLAGFFVPVEGSPT